MNFVKSLAKQLGPKGIRVNGVAPGPIWTPLKSQEVPPRARWSPLVRPRRLGALVSQQTFRDLCKACRGRWKLYDRQRIRRRWRPGPAMNTVSTGVATCACYSHLYWSQAFGTGVLAQTPIPPLAKDFVLNAAQSDQYEIAAAQLALGQSQNPAVRSFAQAMAEDHARMNTALREAGSIRLAFPTASNEQRSSRNAGSPSKLRGPTFDRAYLKQQILAHTQALAVEKSYATSGLDKNLTRIARSAIPVIQHHLEMATQLEAQFAP